MVMTPKGWLGIVLHAHLPFVREPEYEFFMEELWFYEAMLETYLPLLDKFTSLLNEGVDFNLTMSITPPLMEMMRDELLKQRFERHFDKLQELAEKEVWRTKFDERLNKVARMYKERFSRLRRLWESNGKDILGAFKKISDTGHLEIITCGATHGFLPLLQVNEKAVEAQIKIGVDIYRRHMGKDPVGIWLPECAYYPRVDKFLAKYGIRFFVMETHGVLFAKPMPRYGVYAPIYCPDTFVAAFGRDVESGKAVWSAQEGYPGDFDYREFYRDIGYDLDFDYIAPYIHPDGIRINTGIKYHRITGRVDLSQKDIYDPDKALEKAALHAGNFMFNREKQVEWLRSHMDREPVIVAPYDAELFGHWWFEGPDFLYFLFKKIHYDQNNIKTVTLKQYLNMYPQNQVAEPAFSSWGYKGYCEVWLNGTNDWIYPHLHMAADRMVEVTTKFKAEYGKKNIVDRAITQMARELLLAQSSDWAFLIKMGTAVEYSTKRTRQHIWNFNRLYEMVNGGNIDQQWLAFLEWKDNIFSELDWRVYVADN